MSNMRNTKPEVAMDGRYSKTEACKLLGKENKPIQLRTLHRWAGRLNITYGLRYCNNEVFLTGKDIIKIWNYSC